MPVPVNFSPARSAGLRVLDGQLSVDPHADQEITILGLEGRDRAHEFRLAARGEKLWHHRIAQGEREFVPRGTTLLFGHENRHDTLLLRSADRDASLLVLGRETRRPFFQRQTIEIGASQLEEPADGDDRIALKRADGRIDLLARLRRGTDPSGLGLHEEANEIRLYFVPQAPCRVLRVRIEPVTGPAIEGDHVFDHSQPDLPPLHGVQATHDPSNERIEIRLGVSDLPTPARATLFLRGEFGDLIQLRDIRNTPIAFALPGDIADPDQRHLLTLARFLSDPEPESLGGQVGRVLTPIYENVLNHIGASRMLGSVKPVLNIVRADGQPPRHDLVAVAPWIFEAQPLAFTGLGAETGLEPLARMASIPAPAQAPELGQDRPLSDWLNRVGADADIPPDLQADALQHGFRALRYRLRETDLHDLVGDGALSPSIRLICGAHVDGLEQLRSFDTNGGGDPLPARIAIQIERHARSCAEAHAAAFVDDIAFRTGLPRHEVGRLLTLMLRAGIEIFAYFRTLWWHATKNETPWLMTILNPTSFRDHLNAVLGRFVATSSPINEVRAPRLAEELRQSIGRLDFVKGPFVETLPDFEKGESLEGLWAEGILDPGWMRCPRQPRHLVPPAPRPPGSGDQARGELPRGHRDRLGQDRELPLPAGRRHPRAGRSRAPGRARDPGLPAERAGQRPAGPDRAARSSAISAIPASRSAAIPAR